ncbi:putative membrane associated hydrolase [Gemmatirosa kalamazoonensis]|uniref:Putative membrane associated hydrolase n=1 Tax=Gemmatirosa kalamazoonensis TaxID=861299 RepID=W0RE28_9BACT|nr:DUF5916 domain-containing protein [Gemmatirosa kalamazoonensis]AHG88585.1 putative membrane associated hydrolase [Gemmatirosa kalamazoonensis]
MTHSPRFRRGRALARVRPLVVALAATPSFLIAQAAARGQTREPGSGGTPGGTMPSASDPRPVADAAARTGSVSIDGRLDDAAWAAARPITGFLQQQPDEGKAPSERTELRFLYDASALYIGARMYDARGAAGVRSLLARRDQLMDGNAPSDKIAVVLDPFRDKNTRVWFELNPLGVKGDHLNGDESFDPVWEGAAHVDSLGWTAEFRIPLSQLRFSRDSVQAWGLQVWRTISRRNEQDMWAFWRLNEAGGPPYFGTLQGLAVASQPRQMEFLPYVVTGQRFAPVAIGDPFHHRSTNTTRIGADAKVNLTSNLTLDATINPDFGQVEVDPAVVNLSAFETFFREKRPFFVANASAFSFGTFKCFFCSNVSSLDVFYSRRIGRSPQLSGVVGNVADWMDAPDATTILGAAKITGRTKTGWTVGVLDALTDRETARYVPAAAPGNTLPVALTTRDAAVEPLTNYFMGRLRKDLRGGNTRIGGIATLTSRALGADTVMRSRLRSDAEAVGVDLAHYWRQRTYALDVVGVVSNVAGDTAAMRRTQQSSAHYFQRPGRTATGDGLFDAAYDPRRTSLQGYGLYAHLAKESGDWMWELGQNWRSPGFEVNDIAFQSRADYGWMNANLVRQWTKPTAWYRNAFAVIGGQQQYNYDGDRTDLQGQIFGQVTLSNYYNVSGFVIHHPHVLDDRLMRGGPTVVRSGYDFYTLNASSDSRKPVAVDASGNVGRSTDNEGRSWSVSSGVSVRPSPRMLLRLSPSYSFDRTVQQYVTAVSDPTATAFAGARYVFGRIEQRTVALETRLNTTFTPTLTLELYAQPFLSSGRYDKFQEFVRPRSIDMAA